MEISGEYRIAAPGHEVWARLLNPEVLRACIPGCKELNRTGDNSYDGLCHKN
jgi:carbon monoxide dehydrogenase subunit G